MAGKFIASIISVKAIYNTRQEVLDEVLVPAFTAAGSTNPKALASNAYYALRDEKKILEIA
jgi:hypothetical protein